MSAPPPLLGAALRSAWWGLLAGAVTLGIAGRVLMRATAMVTGGRTGFSLGGTLEVIAAGALYGALGGALLPLLPPRLGWWRAPLHAAALFALLALVSGAARSAAGSIDPTARGAVLAAFALLLLAYSALLVWLTDRARRSSS